MKSPKVTVLMSVYNGEKYLCEAVDSIRNQTFEDFEFLIINDGSTDRTAEILQSYDDPRIKIINNEKNIGLTKSLNKGLGMAKGEYIARMDADDISLPERLKKQKELLDTYQDVGVAISDVDLIDTDGKVTSNWNYGNITPEYFYFHLHYHTSIVHPSAMFRKFIGGEQVLYDDNFIYAQDFSLWNHLIHISKVQRVNDTLFCLRQHSERISEKKYDLQRNDALKVIKNNLVLYNISSDDLAKRIYSIYSIYDDSFFGATLREMYTTLLKLFEYNNLIIDNYPSFYDKQRLIKIAKGEFLSLYLTLFKRSKPLSLKFVFHNSDVLFYLIKLLIKKSRIVCVQNILKRIPTSALPKLQNNTIKCPLCKYNKIFIYSKVKETIKYKKVKMDYDFIIGKCCKCGFIFVVNPSPKKITDTIYEELLYDSFEDNRPVKRNVFYDDHFLDLNKVEKRRLNHEKMLLIIKKNLNKDTKDFPPRLLELGCAYGHFLDLAKSSGFDVYGIELSKECVDYCHGIGLKNVFCGAVESDYCFKENYFDVIVMEQVVEHLHNPMEVITKLSKLLKYHGLFYIECPIFQGDNVPLDQIHPVEHINYFSQKTLDLLMTNTRVLRKLENNLYLKV